jgi:hypothetical protein
MCSQAGGRASPDQRELEVRGGKRATDSNDDSAPTLFEGVR